MPPTFGSGARRLRELLLERLLQRSLLVEKALALGRQHPMQPHGLPDQIGDHLEEAEVGVEPRWRSHRPKRERSTAFRATFSSDLIGAPMNDTRPSMRLAISAGGPLEQGVLRDVFHDDRRSGRDQAVEHGVRQGVDRLAGRLARPAGGGDDLRLAVLVEDDDHPQPHVEKAGQHVDHVAERLIEPRGGIEDLGDLVKPQEGNVGRWPSPPDELGRPGDGPSKAPLQSQLAPRLRSIPDGSVQCSVLIRKCATPSRLLSCANIRRPKHFPCPCRSQRRKCRLLAHGARLRWAEAVRRTIAVGRLASISAKLPACEFTDSPLRFCTRALQLSAATRHDSAICDFIRRIP